MYKIHKFAIGLGVILSLTGCTDLLDPLHDGELSYIQPRKANNVAHYPGHGGVIISNGRDNNDTYVKSVCVAPPAQAAQEITLKILSTLAAQAETKGVDANLTLSRTYDLATSTSKLYEQNERTLLLQYSLYRLCEAHMNGMFDPYENPALELLKLQDEHKSNKTINNLIDQRLKNLVNVENNLSALITQRDSLLESNKSDKNFIEELSKIDKEIRTLKSQYYKNTYKEAFEKILDTAVKLATIDRDRAVAEAEHARYVQAAEKDKEDANKNIATAEQKVDIAEKKVNAAQGKLDEMNKRLIDKALCGVDCKDNNKSSVK